MSYYYDFNECIENAKYRDSIKKEEALFIKNQIISLNKYVQKIKSENPDLTFEELDSIFIKDYEEILDTIFSNGFILDYSMSYSSCLYLSDKKEKFNELLQEYLDYQSQPGERKIPYPDEYSVDFNKNLKYFISELKNSYDAFIGSEEFNGPEMQKLKNLLLDDKVSNSEKVKICNATSSSLSYGPRKHFKKFTDCIKNGEFSYLKYHQEQLKEELLKSLIDSISSIARQLEKFGFMEKYPTRQENSLEKITGITNFSTPIQSSKNCIGLESLSNPNYLSTLSLDTLLALNNFWSNRLIKEMDTYFEGIFAIRQLDLLPKMFDGSFNPDELSFKELKNLFFKMNFLYKPTKSYWSYASSLDKDLIDIKEIEGKSYYFMSNRSLVNNMNKSLGEKYKEYFDNILPNNTSNNNVIKDLNLYWRLFTPIMNAYSFKDYSILSTIALTQALNLSPNFGVVLDQSYVPEQKQSRLNFWIDFKGLNFPIRQHISTYTLKNFLEAYNESPLIPIYMDSQAFSGIPSHIVFPFNQKQTSFLKNQKKCQFQDYSNNPTALKFLKHSLYLLNPKKLKKDSDKFYLDLSNFRTYRSTDNITYTSQNNVQDVTNSDKIKEYD